MVDFADNLVFDDRVDICFAFDPRDPERRRLQNLEQCDYQDCNNCAYTAGKCFWDPNFNMCLEPRKKLKKQKWYNWFADCKDDMQLCFSNRDAIIGTAGSLQEAFNNGEALVFSIFPSESQEI